MGNDEIDEGKGVDALAEELLEHSEQLKRIKFYFDLQQRTAEGYPFVTDLHTGIVMISDRMVEEYELPGTILVDFDRYWIPLLYSEDVADYEKSFEHIFDPGHSGEHNIEYRVRNRKGEYTWVHCHGIVGRDEAGEPVLFAGSIMKMDRILHADPVTGLLNRYAF
ncbi:MAG: PAS domain-containing protein, partial [Selenomonadaceae bacterium]|nr:PAS domain-containing protein [Selenomonadaceae bacterium]